MDIKQGTMLMHYKGKGPYVVDSISKHTETGELLVNYHLVANQHVIWSRPLSMFSDTVIVDGKPMPRFTEI